MADVAEISADFLRLPQLGGAAGAVSPPPPRDALSGALSPASRLAIARRFGLLFAAADGGAALAGRAAAPADAADAPGFVRLPTAAVRGRLRGAGKLGTVDLGTPDAAKVAVRTGTVTHLALSADELTLWCAAASKSGGATVRAYSVPRLVHEPAGADPTQVASSPSAVVRDLAPSPVDPAKAAVLFSDGKLFRCSADGTATPVPPPEGGATFTALAWSASGDGLVVGLSTGDILRMSEDLKHTTLVSPPENAGAVSQIYTVDADTFFVSYLLDSDDTQDELYLVGTGAHSRTFHPIPNPFFPNDSPFRTRYHAAAIKDYGSHPCLLVLASTTSFDVVVLGRDGPDWQIWKPDEAASAVLPRFAPPDGEERDTGALGIAVDMTSEEPLPPAPGEDKPSGPPVPVLAILNDAGQLLEWEVVDAGQVHAGVKKGAEVPKPAAGKAGEAAQPGLSFGAVAPPAAKTDGAPSFSFGGAAKDGTKPGGLFGTPAADAGKPGGVFGTPAAPVPKPGGLFGTPSGGNAAKPAAPLFGAPSSDVSKPLFGLAPAADGVKPLFGQPAKEAPKPGGLFGAAPASSGPGDAKPLFGASGGSAAAKPAQPSFSFGAAAPAASAGATTTPAQPAFGFGKTPTAAADKIGQKAPEKAATPAAGAPLPIPTFGKPASSASAVSIGKPLDLSATAAKAAVDAGGTSSKGVAPAASSQVLSTQPPSKAPAGPAPAAAAKRPADKPAPAPAEPEPEPANNIVRSYRAIVADFRAEIAELAAFADEVSAAASESRPPTDLDRTVEEISQELREVEDGNLARAELRAELTAKLPDIQQKAEYARVLLKAGKDDKAARRMQMKGLGPEAEEMRADVRSKKAMIETQIRDISKHLEFMRANLERIASGKDRPSRMTDTEAILTSISHITRTARAKTKQIADLARDLDDIRRQLRQHGAPGRSFDPRKSLGTGVFGLIDELEGLNLESEQEEAIAPDVQDVLDAWEDQRQLARTMQASLAERGEVKLQNPEESPSLRLTDGGSGIVIAARERFRERRPKPPPPEVPAPLPTVPAALPAAPSPPTPPFALQQPPSLDSTPPKAASPDVFLEKSRAQAPVAPPSFPGLAALPVPKPAPLPAQISPPRFQTMTQIPQVVYEPSSVEDHDEEDDGGHRGGGVARLPRRRGHRAEHPSPGRRHDDHFPAEGSGVHAKREPENEEPEEAGWQQVEKAPAPAAIAVQDASATESEDESDVDEEEWVEEGDGGDNPEEEFEEGELEEEDEGEGEEDEYQEGDFGEGAGLEDESPTEPPAEDPKKAVPAFSFAKPAAGFGFAAAAGSAKPFGPATPTSSAPALPTFSKPASGFSFGAAAQVSSKPQEEEKPAATASAPPPKPAGGFSFGAAAAATSTAAGATDKGKEATPSKAPSGFVFGGSQTASKADDAGKPAGSATQVSGFSFGAAAKAQKEEGAGSTTPAAEPKPVGGFTFGGAAAAAKPGGFTFAGAVPAKTPESQQPSKVEEAKPEAPKDDAAAGRKESKDAAAAASTPSQGFNWAAAGIAKPIAPAGGWECTTCMVRNAADATKCAACEAPRPGPAAAKAGTDSSAVKPGEAEAAAKPAAALSGGFNWAAAGVKPPGESAEQWKCPTCMVMNKDADEKCVSCEAPKPGKAAASAAGPPASSGGFNWAAAGMKAPTAEKDTWKCPTCMVSNKDADAKCASCETPKPGAAPAKTAVAPSTGGFTFGTSTSSTPSKPSFSFGAAAAAASATPSSAAKPPGGFTFGVSPAPAPAPAETKTAPADSNEPAPAASSEDKKSEEASVQQAPSDTEKPAAKPEPEAAKEPPSKEKGPEPQEPAPAPPPPSTAQPAPVPSTPAVQNPAIQEPAAALQQPEQAEEEMMDEAAEEAPPPATTSSGQTVSGLSGFGSMLGGLGGSSSTPSKQGGVSAMFGSFATPPAQASAAKPQTGGGLFSAGALGGFGTTSQSGSTPTGFGTTGFGAAAQSSAFGSTSTSSAFGGAATPSAFGSGGTPSAFGATSSPSAFGGKPAFGQSTGFGQASAFGTPSQPQSTFGSTSAFGQTSPLAAARPAQTSAFGQSSFGRPTAFGQSAFGQSGFGTPSQLGSGSGFGATSQLGGAGFGATSQLGGASAFGASPAKPSTGFGAFGSQATSTFGSTAGTGGGFGGFGATASGSTAGFGAVPRDDSAASIFGSSSAPAPRLAPNTAWGARGGAQQDMDDD